MKSTVALIGTAHIHTPQYVDLLRSRDDVTVALVWDHDSQRAREAATQLSAEAITDVDRIWADARIQGVVICSETALHPPLVKSAISASKAIFVEKPFALTAADALPLAHAIEQGGNLFHTGFFLRHHPSVKRLHAAATNGEFGRISRIHASLSHGAALDGWFDNDWKWMVDPAALGPDAFFDLGVHLIDLLKWFCGPINRVIYDSNALLNRYPGVSEFGIGMVAFEGGQFGVIETSWIDDGTPTALTINGTKGSATLSTTGFTVRGQASSRTSWQDIPALTLSASEGLASFLDALSGKPAELVSASDAAETAAIVDAFVTSRHSGSWANVEPLRYPDR